MKLKSLLMIFFLLAGSLYLQAQSSHSTAKVTGPVPLPILCTGLDNLKQECDINGNVVITFNVRNYTVNNVSNVWVYLDDNTTVASLGGILAPEGISPTITYQVPSGETNVCFNIRLFNTQGQSCCFARHCYEIDECACGDIGATSIDCKNNGGYEFCFEVYNSSNSTNTVDAIMLNSLYPDLCIDGIATPAPIAIAPITPGSTATICVELEGCNSPIFEGNLITITPHLLELSDPSFCCDQDPITVTIPPPCCSLFESIISSSAADCDISNGSVTLGVSGGTAPYTVTVSGFIGGSFSGTSFTKDNLPAGTYSYIVTDVNGCASTGTVTIDQNECSCGDIGTTSIDCKNNGAYEFCFEVYNPSSSTNIVDAIMLSSLYPDLCINGITAPAPIGISPIFPGSIATVCVELEGCNSTITSGDLITITPHLLEFSDPSFCCDQDPITVAIPPSCCSQFESTISSSPTDCGISNGSVTLGVSGGTAPYTVTVLGFIGGSFLGTSFTKDNLPAGTYSYIVTDANGCASTGTVTVGENGCCSQFGSTAISSPNCKKLFIGSITVSVSNGTAPYSITIMKNSQWGGFSFSGSFSGTSFTQNNLASGTYDYTITDANGCVTTGTTIVGYLYSGCLIIDDVPLPLPLPRETLPDVEVNNELMRVNNSMDQSNSLQVFPNPVREILSIKNANPEIQFETINILDASGKIIQKDNMSGNSEIRVDVSSLPRGIYFIDGMDSSGNKVTERFVKID